MQLRIAGAVTGAAAVYFAWAFFAWVMVFRSNAADAPTVWQWIQNPAALWSFAGAVAEDGWYTLGRSLTPKGIVLWAFWAIEAAIVIGIGALYSPMRILGRGFCEDCDEWMAEQEPVMVPADEGAPGLALKKHGLPGVQEVKPPSEGARRWLRLGRQRCPRCQQAAVYQADELTAVKTEKGTKTEVSPLLPLAWQRDAERAELERIEQLLQAADAARFAALQQKPAAGG